MPVQIRFLLPVSQEPHPEADRLSFHLVRGHFHPLNIPRSVSGRFHLFRKIDTYNDELHPG